MQHPDVVVGNIFDRVRFMLAWYMPISVVVAFYTDERLQWLVENYPLEWRRVLVALVDFEITHAA